MKAAWYTKFGSAQDVLEIDEREDPIPGDGEVCVRVHATAANPSDVKLRAGARPGATMAFPLIIPHSDGAGVIDAVGEGVSPDLIGSRVWIWNGQWKRPYGTAAEKICVPKDQAVPLPENTALPKALVWGFLR